MFSDPKMFGGSTGLNALFQRLTAGERARVMLD
jgi:hypothetical protein